MHSDLKLATMSAADRLSEARQKNKEAAERLAKQLAEAKENVDAEQVTIVFFLRKRPLLVLHMHVRAPVGPSHLANQEMAG